VYALTVSTVTFPRATAATSATSPESDLAKPAVSNAQRATQRRRITGVSVVLFVVLLQAATQYLSGLESARILCHLGFLAFELPTIMAALSVTYAWSTRRQLGAMRTLGATLLVAGTFGAGFGVILTALSQHFPTMMLRPVPNFTFARGALYGFSFGNFHMGLWALAFAFPFAIDAARVKDLEAETLRSAAELARLRAHLEPHFLLNTLNAIAGLVTEDPREARRLIACLGDLLRDALHDDELQTLHEQILWLEKYTAILQARHAGSLEVAWDIAPDTRSTLLPPLLLQPLVENGVKHGALRRRGGGGKVKVTVRWTEGDRLSCVIDDNGPGVPPGEVRSGAFGLRAVSRRLELHYPGSRVWLEPTLEGTRATLEIPRAAIAREAPPRKPLP
jgi:signal transduction histidine kinase